MTKLSVLKIIADTVVDGPGYRTSVYLAGCSHRCPGCHNSWSWDINNGTQMEVGEILQQIVDAGHKKVTITGGDPFFQKKELYELVRLLEKRGYNIWVYTGYTLDELEQDPDSVKILKYIDVLVDGRFVEGLKDRNLKFRGSKNQKIRILKEFKENYKEILGIH